MESPKKVSSKVTSSTTEKILLALIPVIGSIIIAFISVHDFKCNSDDKIDVIRISKLRVKAGELNDHVAYGRYQDILPMLAEGIKPYITEKIFYKEADSIKLDLGEFIKPIDTIYSKAFGNDNFFIKNQYHNGLNIVTITFDQNEKVIGLTTKHVPKTVEIAH